ncbi:MAG: hypothetical protein WCF22_15330, partial [Candidatus Sulfotelmatobacter sp.]
FRPPWGQFAPMGFYSISRHIQAKRLCERLSREKNISGERPVYLARATANSLLLLANIVSHKNWNEFGNYQNILSWGMADIFGDKGKAHRDSFTVVIQRRGNNYIDSYPRSAGHLQLARGSIGGLGSGVGRVTIGVIHSSGVDGVDHENNQSHNFQEEFGIANASRKLYLEVAKAFFYFCSAFVFMAPGLVHIQSVVLKCQGWSLLGLLLLSLTWLGIGVFFVVLICNSFDRMHKVSNHVAGGLPIVVSVVIPSAFFGDEFGMENIAAVRSPVLYAEDVVVRDPSVDNNKRFGVPEFFFQRSGEDNRLGMSLPVLNSLKAFGDFPIWENGSGLNPIVGVARCVSEIQRLVFLENAYDDAPSDVPGRSLSSIDKFGGNQKGFAESKSHTTSLEAKPYPCTLVNSEIPVRINNALMGILRHPFIDTPNCNRGESVDNKNYQSESFKSKRDLIYPVAFYVAGNLGMLAAWLSIGLCRRWWTGALRFLGMICGLTLAVINGPIALDGIVGAF